MIDPKFREAHEALDNAIQYTQNLTIAAWELANGLDSASRTGNALLGTLSLAEEKTMEAEEASAAVWEAMRKLSMADAA